MWSLTLIMETAFTNERVYHVLEIDGWSSQGHSDIPVSAMVMDKRPYWVTLHGYDQGVSSLLDTQRLVCFESAQVTLDGRRVWSQGRGYLVRSTQADSSTLRIQVRLPGHLEPITYTYEIQEYTMPDGVEGDWYLTTTSGIIIILVQVQHSKKLKVRQMVYNDIIKRSYVARTTEVSLHDHQGAPIAHDYERIVLRRMTSEKNNERYRWV